MHVLVSKLSRPVLIQATYSAYGWWPCINFLPFIIICLVAARDEEPLLLNIFTLR